MPRVIHFDLYANDVPKAIKFYTDVFGWTIQKWDNPAMDYWLVSTGAQGEPGIDGGLAKRETPTESFETNLSLNVASAEGIIKKAIAHGGKLVLPTGAIPGVGWFAKIADPDGNIFGVMQDDPKAM